MTNDVPPAGTGAAKPATTPKDRSQRPPQLVPPRPLAEVLAGIGPRGAPATPKLQPHRGTTTRPIKRPPSPKVDPSGGTTSSGAANQYPKPKKGAPRHSASRSAKVDPTPKEAASSGTVTTRQTTKRSTVKDQASAGVKPAGRHGTSDAHTPAAPGTPGSDQAVMSVSTLMCRSLLDPTLALAADVLDDIERVRIANENRLRQLTRSVDDVDGEMRGFGLTEDHPSVARLAAIVDTLVRVEKDATKALEKSLQAHPLHPWIKAQHGIGDKQAARLLAAIGDPYIRPELSYDDGTIKPEGPRTVSALWAYAGYHTVAVPVSQPAPAAHTAPADRGSMSADQTPTDAQGRSVGGTGGHPHQNTVNDQDRYVWVAAKRARGQRANWSSTAKMRAHLVAEKVVQLGHPGYRAVYDARRAVTADRVHAIDCVRCGPSGKPAKAGSPWSKGHQHADALRIVAKTILRDLWREARRIHTEAAGGDQLAFDTQGRRIVAGPELPTDHVSLDETQDGNVGGDWAAPGQTGSETQRTAAGRGPTDDPSETAGSGQSPCATQSRPAAASPDVPAGHRAADTHRASAGGDGAAPDRKPSNIHVRFAGGSP